MPAPIVVEVYSPAPRAEELSVLLAACSRAAAPTECVRSEDRGTDGALGVAIVRRDGDRARIELGLRGDKGSEWMTRELLFQVGDDETERLRAIGFAVGTLVVGKPDPEPAAPPLTPPPQSTATVPAVVIPPPALPGSGDADEGGASPSRRHGRSAWVDTAAGLGLGLLPGPARFSTQLRTSLELRPGGAFGVLELTYAQSTSRDPLFARWLGVSLGVGHPLGPSEGRLGLELRLEAVLERLMMEVERDERTGSGNAWKPGLSLCLDGRWEVADPMSLVLTGASRVDLERTIANAQAEKVAETPVVAVSGFLGLRFRLR